MRRSLRSVSIPLAAATTFVAVYAMPPPPRRAPVDAYYSGCNEARAAGVTPIYRGEPGYREGMDGDGDGIACEPHRY